MTNEINSSAHVRKLSIETPKTEPEKSVPQTPVTREASSDIHTQSPPQLVQSEDSENELRRLMQQTDDAKVTIFVKIKPNVKVTIIMKN